MAATLEKQPQGKAKATSNFDDPPTTANEQSSSIPQPHLNHQPTQNDSRGSQSRRWRPDSNAAPRHSVPTFGTPISRTRCICLLPAWLSRTSGRQRRQQQQQQHTARNYPDTAYANPPYKPPARQTVSLRGKNERRDLHSQRNDSCSSFRDETRTNCCQASVTASKNKCIRAAGKKRLSFALLPCRKKKRVAERREREDKESRTACCCCRAHLFS
jgi:hypothetical protein